MVIGRGIRKSFVRRIQVLRHQSNPPSFARTAENRALEKFPYSVLPYVLLIRDLRFDDVDHICRILLHTDSEEVESIGPRVIISRRAHHPDVVFGIENPRRLPGVIAPPA